MIYYNQNKYHAKKVNYGGMTFASQKEYTRWCELNILLRAKKISNLQRQVKFELIPVQKDSENKIKERECSYIADFVYHDNELDQMVVEDAKSPATRTKEYIIKRKLMLYRFGIAIKEV